MASPAVKGLVLECWLGSGAHTGTLRVTQLSSGVPHGLGPEIVSQLGSDDLGIAKEGRSGVLTLVLDSSILCAMEVSILK